MYEVAGPELFETSRQLAQQGASRGLWDALVLANVLCHIPSRAVLHHKVKPISLLGCRKDTLRDATHASNEERVYLGMIHERCDIGPSPLMFLLGSC